MEETDSTDAFRVYGRGELHLSILIETMRRQGYEFQITKPEVIYKEIDGVKCEPVEIMVADVPTEYSGVVIEKIGRRKGTLISMHGENRMRLEFEVPSRGLFGYRSEFLTDTRGEGVMSSVFDSYKPYQRRYSHPQYRRAGRLGGRRDHFLRALQRSGSRRAVCGFGREGVQRHDYRPQFPPRRY